MACLFRSLLIRRPSQSILFSNIYSSSIIHNNLRSISQTERKSSEINKNPRRIDTHHHVIPDFYAEIVQENDDHPCLWQTPKWSVQQAKEHMSILGIETAIVSIPEPGTKIYDNNKKKGRYLARKFNEFLADLVKNNPKQFGFFASLPPLIDIEGTINEIDYVHSLLKPDGFILLTSYGRDQYLGHPSFQPIWETLNELKTVVFIHPNEASTPIVNRYLPHPIIDFPQETTRTVSDLVLSGTRAAFPDVKIILSHAGGTLPFLGHRVAKAALVPHLHYSRNDLQILADFRSFYYDTALSSSVPELQALLQFADPSKILFGSDIPYGTLPTALDFTNNLDSFFLKNKLDQQENLWQAINRENAKILFPEKIKD